MLFWATLGEWNFLWHWELYKYWVLHNIIFPQEEAKEPLGKSSDNDLQRASLLAHHGIKQTCLCRQKNHTINSLVAGLFAFDRHNWKTLAWSPWASLPGIHILCNSSHSVGGTCDLLLINRTWQRRQIVISVICYLTLYYPLQEAPSWLALKSKPSNRKVPEARSWEQFPWKQLQSDNTGEI